MDVNEELKSLCKFKKKFIIFFWGGGLSGSGDQGGCERRIEIFVKIQKKKNYWGGGGRVGGGSGWGVRVDVKEN